ncbi:MAG: lytic transglycosylase domain-containing protein [Elusimicrobia bacterium]|nr:lytic transglycosylase domain-containing protein [Elusimicrobiota bacterium]
MAPSPRSVLAVLAVALCAASARAAVPAAADAKTEYRVYLLAREAKTPSSTPDRADPIWGLVADLRREIERLGAKVEKTGTFNTPTPEGGERANEVTVLSASWTKEELERARALGRGADHSVADDYSAAAMRLGVTLKALPDDPAELARRLKAQPAPARAPAAVPPAPTAPGALQFDAFVEKEAARTGVDPEVLRGLIFAAQGYSGGFARTTGLHGPMGLSMATARDLGLDRRGVEDPAANIAAGADYYKKLLAMFGGDKSRAVAAFYCGSGAVRQSRGIPPDCSGFVSQFYLSYQNGAAWAIDRNAPRRRRPASVQEPVSRPAAVGRAAREDATAAVRGDTPPNREWTSKRMPDSLIAKVLAAASRNPFDPSVKLDASIFMGLVWAEGGYSSENKHPNAWGAVGPAQVTYSGAAPHCMETNAKGKKVYDWKGISDWSGRKNVDFGAKVYYDRIQWTATKDPIIGLALYNTQQKHWQRIISRNQVPPFPETVSYVMRAAHVACSRTGVQLLTPEHFEGGTAQRLARAAERQLERDEFPYEKIDVDPACTVFRR